MLVARVRRGRLKVRDERAACVAVAFPDRARSWTVLRTQAPPAAADSDASCETGCTSDARSSAAATPAASAPSTSDHDPFDTAGDPFSAASDPFSDGNDWIAAVPAAAPLPQAEVAGPSVPAAAPTAFPCSVPTDATRAFPCRQLVTEDDPDVDDDAADSGSSAASEFEARARELERQYLAGEEGRELAALLAARPTAPTAASTPSPAVEAPDASATAALGESYERTPAAAKAFLRFQRRLALRPRQCLRWVGALEVEVGWGGVGWG